MKAVIIEDESIIAKELCSAIEEVADDIEILCVLPSLKTAKKWFLNNAEPDLLFMDIQLSDGVSFEIFDHFTLTCPVIFISAYNDYAIKAFKKNGIDYLLKPIEPEELKNAIDKCRTSLKLSSTASDNIQKLVAEMLSTKTTNIKERFVVQVRNKWIPIDTNLIACFFRDNLNYLITFKGEKHMLSESTLEEVETMIDAKQYFRANRQYIIHVKTIDSVKVLEDSRLLVQLNSPLNLEIEISRKKAPEFRKWLAQ